MNATVAPPSPALPPLPLNYQTPRAPGCAAGAGQRLASLDAYRGLIMLTLLCGAIFKSLKGTPWHWLYEQNEHVPWAGCTYWDLIQPSFMFMVGVAMPFAVAKRAAEGQSALRRGLHVLIRAVNLCIVGILLDHVGAQKIQISFMRVLQQIAIGYVIAAPFVGRGLLVQGIAAAAILVGYQCLWMFNPYNGPGGPWAMGNQNIGSALDRWMLGRNYNGYYVGMNAIPSAATILFGVMAGGVIRRQLSKGKTMAILLAAGVAGIGLGLAVSPWFPLIKRIWTPSFAVFAGGCTTLMLLAFYFVIEVVGFRWWAYPLVVVGTNSIAAYVIGNGFGSSLRGWTGAWITPLKPHVAEPWYPVIQQAAGALMAWLVLWWLYRRRIFFKC